jgi:hypothetical protein
MTLLLNQAVTVPIATTTSPVMQLRQGDGVRCLTTQASFTCVGATGNTNSAGVRIFVQTSCNFGNDWTDIASYGWSPNADAGIIGSVGIFTIAPQSAPISAPAQLSDGALTAGSAVNILGDCIRLKYNTTGTFSSGAKIIVHAVTPSGLTPL